MSGTAGRLRLPVTVVLAAVCIALAPQASPPSPEFLHAGLSGSDPLHIGKPFTVIVEAEAPAGVNWDFPAAPRRFGYFTLRSAVAEAGKDGNPNRWVIRLVFQAFRTGELPLPRIPLKWEAGAGAGGLLAWDPPRVTVRDLLEGPGPFQPKPSRGGFDVRAPAWWPWWATVAGAALLAAAAWFVWRRRRRAAATGDGEVGEIVSLQGFLDRLDALRKRGRGGLEDRKTAAAAMELFREYLEWRFGIDLSALTTREILSALDACLADGPIDPSRFEQLLRSGEFACFAPEPSGAKKLLDELKKGMLELGSPEPAPEETNASLSAAS
ncbi:MAG: DUF4381 family protein [Acidobacteria bacterium]|nr:DUF4381 family protein [Acidobacteriota bacterium]